VQDVGYALKRRAVRLLGSANTDARFYLTVPEIYSVFIAPSMNDRPRFNLLVPTANPSKLYGGIATALKVASDLLANWNVESDVRVVLTSDRIDAESIGEAACRLGRSLVLANPEDDPSGSTIVPLAEKRFGGLALRRNDIFMATAWWTAHLAFRLREQQLEIFGKGSRVIYLIQDYEPGFYSWSDHYALAESTYRQGRNTVAVINSEELANYFERRFVFWRSYCLPFSLNGEIYARLRPTPKERIVLAYGRPSVARNWRPAVNCQWRIIFAGEEFDKTILGEIENSAVVGKLPIAEYAELLNRAAVGLSLMISPHPSYPPLEMASAGCVTITNAFECKNLSLRADNIISLDEVSPVSVADALDRAVLIANHGASSALPELRPVGSAFGGFDPKEFWAEFEALQLPD
jgi:hypothetical protein